MFMRLDCGDLQSRLTLVLNFRVRFYSIIFLTMIPMYKFTYAILMAVTLCFAHGYGYILVDNASYADRSWLFCNFAEKRIYAILTVNEVGQG